MGFDADLALLGISLKVLFVDLLLSGDNAVVIALACRSLPPGERRKAVLIGTAAAILLRVYLTTVATTLLDIPGLKLVGALALVVIAVKLLIEEDQGASEAHLARRNLELWAAVMLIVIADLIMSLDNVVAVAAVAQGRLFFLALGLGFSIPLLMWGSSFVAVLFRRYPRVITGGGALLGWAAGDLGVSDPVVAPWVGTQAPALMVAIPLLAAIFVVLESRIIDGERKAAKARGGRVVPAVEAAAGSEQAAEGVAEAPRRRTKPAPALRYLPPSIDEALAGRALILVAEDNPLDQGAVKRALEGLGFAVEVADDGGQALAMLAKRPYGLLMTDHRMPNMDGFDLTRRIRAEEAAHGPRLPIIGLLGMLSDDQMVRRCLEAGMDDCLRKPMAAPQLEAAVMTWLPAALSLRRHAEPAGEGRTSLTVGNETTFPA